jgi:hypothetical protein
MEHVCLIAYRFSQDYSNQLKNHAAITLEAARIKKDFQAMLELFESH